MTRGGEWCRLDLVAVGRVRLQPVPQRRRLGRWWLTGGDGQRNRAEQVVMRLNRRRTPEPGHRVQTPLECDTARPVVAQPGLTAVDVRVHRVTEAFIEGSDEKGADPPHTRWDEGHGTASYRSTYHAAATQREASNHDRTMAHGDRAGRVRALRPHHGGRVARPGTRRDRVRERAAQRVRAR